jgi:phosphoribosylamine--glycine ligase
MNVLVIGSGGREHALVWKIGQSSKCDRLFCAPGNAGIAQDAECVNIPSTDTDALIMFARRENIGLTVVGPEQPLVDGLVDRIEAERLSVFGPSKAAADIEGGKVFAKRFMHKYGIPTAKFEAFDSNQRKDAEAFVRKSPCPLVVKADGLAAGKGAIVCSTADEALDALDLMMGQRAFGTAGSRVVVEEFMAGEEVSVLALTDGIAWKLLPPAQDHKRALDGDRGKNTGGMGAYAPAPFVDHELLQRIEREILRPTIEGLAHEGRPFKGCLYLGLMLTVEGPKVVEYNCRFGDPETQAVLPLLTADFLELLFAAASGGLENVRFGEPVGSAICVVMASGGYPESYETGKVVRGLDSRFEEGVRVFHAGTKHEGNEVVTSGGRVLGVTAVDDDLQAAISKAYRSVAKISFEKAHYRTDIGAKGLKRLASAAAVPSPSDNRK